MSRGVRRRMHACRVSPPGALCNLFAYHWRRSFIFIETETVRKLLAIISFRRHKVKKIKFIKSFTGGEICCRCLSSQHAWSLRDAASSWRSAFWVQSFVFLRTSRQGSACCTCLCTSCSTRTWSSCLPSRRAPARGSPSTWVPPVRHLTSSFHQFACVKPEVRVRFSSSLVPHQNSRDDLISTSSIDSRRVSAALDHGELITREYLTSSCLLLVLGRHRSALSNSVYASRQLIH